MVSFKCKECSFATGRSYNLRRHLKNVHGVVKSTGVHMKTSDGTSQLGDRPPKRPRIQEPDDGVYTNKKYEETMDTLDGSVSWEMDCLDVNRELNLKMDCIPRKSTRKLWILYELGFQR